MFPNKRLISNGIGHPIKPHLGGAEAIVNYLQDFGLTTKEAKINFLLSKAGSATASDLAGAAQLSRLQTYRAIKSLLSNGLVEMSLERPRRYIPLKIEQALHLLGQEAERRILELEKKTPLLLKEWAASDDLNIQKPNYSFRIIQGHKNVAKFRIMLCESAEKELASTMKPNDPVEVRYRGC